MAEEIKEILNDDKIEDVKVYQYGIFIITENKEISIITNNNH